MSQITAIQYVNLADVDLVTAYLAGDEMAFRAMVDRYKSLVYNVAYRIVGNAEDAEDAAQDAFVNLALKLDRFEGRSTLKTWIYRVAANSALMTVRTRKRHQHHVSLDAGADDADPRSVDWAARLADPAARADTDALRRETREVIEAAIARLPESFRTVVVLADIEELSNPEVAEVLDLSLPAVKSRLHRARLALRQELAAYAERPAVAAAPRKRSVARPTVRLPRPVPALAC